MGRCPASHPTPPTGGPHVAARHPPGRVRLIPPVALADLGWSRAYADQLTADDTPFPPARITAVHRDRVEAMGADGALSLTLPQGLLTNQVAVGDWVLTDGAILRRLLDRQSVLTRRAAGKGIDRQLIAANLDRLAIVTSCNAEFSAARLDRYVALAHQGGVAPAIVLTKADLTDPAPYLAEATRAARGAPVLAINAKDPRSVQALTEWCGPGQTLGLVGSSGVGKSTLAATLTGTDQETGEIRAIDSRGRHTTSARYLIRTLAGGWLIDTPGMRELRLTDATESIAATFDDIDALARACRFTDCAHDREPGCAIRAALDAGELDPVRLARWRKLLSEETHDKETVAEARARSRASAKTVKGAVQSARRKRDG